MQAPTSASSMICHHVPPSCNVSDHSSIIAGEIVPCRIRQCQFCFPSSYMKSYNGVMNSYQTIAQVSAASGLSAATLRFYEDEGLIPPVPRDGAGNRRYGEHEISRVNAVRCLRAAGLSLADMKRYFSMIDDGADTLRVRREILLQTRERLRSQRVELKRCMDYLALKLEFYGKMIEAVEQGREMPTFSAGRLNKCFTIGDKDRSRG